MKLKTNNQNYNLSFLNFSNSTTSSIPLQENMSHNESKIFSQIKKHTNYTTNNIPSFSTSDLEDSYSLEGKIIKTQYKSKHYIFPMIYFFTSTIFLFILLFVNIFKEKETDKYMQILPMHPFPSFSSFKKFYKNIFSVSIITISLSGILNIWFFCSLLLQRFSVPELKSNKLTVHLMFILGILANLIYIFFGFFPEILEFEHQKIKILKISISMIIFLSFVFFNLLFATMSLNVFQNFKKQIAFSDRRLNKNIQGKRIIAYITLFLLFLYITAIFVKYEINLNEYNASKIDKENLNKIRKHQGLLKNNNNIKNINNNHKKDKNNIDKINKRKIKENQNKLKSKSTKEKNIKKNNTNKITNGDYSIIILNIIDIILFIFPYILFFFNSLLNLSYYFDILYFEDIINIIIDREFFLSSDEPGNFFTEYSCI